MLGWGAWLALLGSTGLLARLETTRAPSFEGVLVARDVVYREAAGRRVRLDVYTPSTPKPDRGWPAVVAVHGGGWRGGSKADFGPMLVPLARAGVVVLAIDYHLGTPREPAWPKNLEDVRAAVRWSSENARELGLDRSRLALLGASAGGHLALLAAFEDGSVTSGDPRRNQTKPFCGVRAVVDFYAPTELASLVAESPTTIQSLRCLLGRDAGENGRLAEASPLHWVTAGVPPVLIVHGREDRLVPPVQSGRLAEALERAGVGGRLVLVDGAKHGFGLQAGARDLTPDLLAFLGFAWKD